MITLHKKIYYNFLFTKFWIGKFFRQFWENLQEIRIGTGAEFRPQIGLKKTLNHTCNQRLISSPFKIPDINYKSLQFSVSDRAGS